MPFHFIAGEGPVIEKPVRTAEDVKVLRTDRAADLGYVADAVAQVAKHFGTKLPVIGFCGAPFTLASYMMEGGGSRHYVEVKKLMYNSPEVWEELVGKLVDVLAEYAAEQVRHRRRRDADLRQLGGLPERGRLSPLCAASRLSS